MYLLDTNIILELLLAQEKADEVERFLRNNQPEHLHLSDYSLHSLGITLLRHKRHDVFLRTVEDLLVRGKIELLQLSIEEMKDLVAVAQAFNLDFDDAYQYAVAEKHDLTIVSFDSDFDRTQRGRKRPIEVLVS